MASNSFGSIFRITTWGESHGKSIGVVIDGCPSGLAIDDKEITDALFLRAPGSKKYTSSRQEKDQAEILSGVFEGKTTGAPLSIIVPNIDVDSSLYEKNKDLLRPGHAQSTYLKKYGVFDYRGGGRASARETVARVAAGAIAKKILHYYGVRIAAFVRQIGDIEAKNIELDAITESPIFCPDKQAEKAMLHLLDSIVLQGDSIGGIVEFIALHLPVGLGDPIYEKLSANLAKAMMSLPASKGFEIGEGFRAACMRGSEHNDLFIESESIATKTNHAGGVLGGISTGMPLVGRVAFKPISTIHKAQETRTISGETAILPPAEQSRHDPCAAIRAVWVVEAMLSIVLVDALLQNRSVCL